MNNFTIGDRVAVRVPDHQLKSGDMLGIVEILDGDAKVEELRTGRKFWRNLGLLVPWEIPVERKTPIQWAHELADGLHESFRRNDLPTVNRLKSLVAEFRSQFPK